MGVNYGPNNGEGIAFYRYGVQVARDTTLTAGSRVIPGSGKLVIGRKRSELTGKYSSIEVDESSTVQPEVIGTGSSNDLHFKWRPT